MSHPNNQLGYGDLETLVDWFTTHMGLEQRAQFMAEHPLIYARLYPEVSPSRIASMVDDAIRTIRTKEK